MTTIEHIEAEVESRRRRAAQLEADIARLSGLVSLKDGQVAAVEQLVRMQLARNYRRGVWQGIATNVVVGALFFFSVYWCAPCHAVPKMSGLER